MPPKPIPREIPAFEPEPEAGLDRDVETGKVAPEAIENIPAGGGFMPAEDGGNPQHPIHDEDEEDRTPEDYERQIDNADGIV